MSTVLTVNSSSPLPRLQLGQLLMHGQQWVAASLLRLMAARGHDRLTAAHLSFLNNLDCGATHAAEVARRMGVSRQAVYRTTRELQRLGVLVLEPDPGRKSQKVVRMTEHGARVALDARECLDRLEVELRERLGARDLELLGEILRRDWGPPLEV